MPTAVCPQHALDPLVGLAAIGIGIGIGIAIAIAIAIGRIQSVLTTLPPLLSTSVALNYGEFDDLVVFLRSSLLDPRVPLPIGLLRATTLEQTSADGKWDLLWPLGYRERASALDGKGRGGWPRIDRMVGYETSKPSFRRPASMDRRARSDLHQRRRRITRRSGSTDAVQFFNLLTSAELLETTEALLPVHRERLYPSTATLSMVMRQTLEADVSRPSA